MRVLLLMLTMGMALVPRRVLAPMALAERILPQTVPLLPGLALAPQP